MKSIYILLLAVLGLVACEKNKPTKNTAAGPISLVIHGGAGTIKRENLSPTQEAAYHAALKQALDAGYAVLESGGASEQAVIATIKIMEDNPLFNAGKGSVFTFDGKNEMDAAIMKGKDLSAGSVAGVTTVKNPITAAFTVMTKSPHVMMSGAGADKFAQESGLEIVDPSYFFDSTRYKQWEEANQKNEKHATYYDPRIKDNKFGTVGAVALDKDGNISAGTSTGGMTNKRWGRIGDAPVIGAGTYANNTTCGISATGHGEYFIRAVVGHSISSLMEYGNLNIEQAADSVVMKTLVRMGGEGGVIGLDRQGNITMTFNSEGMYRGFIKKKGEGKTFIYREEK